jgi:hypothetical protein
MRLHLLGILWHPLWGKVFEQWHSLRTGFLLGVYTTLFEDLEDLEDLEGRESETNET